MARGPLPNPQSRRRNAPTIPATTLPVGGRKGRRPNPPAEYEFGKAGKAWWKWAWTTPQATAWDAGSRYAIARRAQLEDDLAALDDFDPLQIAELLAIEPDEQVRALGFLIKRLKALAGGRLAIVKEMRELEKRLGLDPKAIGELRWTITAEEAEQAKPKRPSSSRRLRAIDGGAT